MALGTDDANSSEFNVFTEHPVIDLMSDQADVTEKGGTMRLASTRPPGGRQPGPCCGYGAEVVYERHRHRFEVNNAYRDRLGEAGMRWSGVEPDDRLVEFIELRDHPWFVATQAHPELKSRPNRPHPSVPRLRGRRGAGAWACRPLRRRASSRTDAAPAPKRRATGARASGQRRRDRGILTAP